MMLLLTCVAFFLGFVEIRSEEVELATIRNKRSTACYGKLGCFSNGAPFVSKKWPITLLPQSPEKIQTLFFLFTRESRDTPQELAASDLSMFPVAWTNYKTRPTKILVHGLSSSSNTLHGGVGDYDPPTNGYLDNIRHMLEWKDMINELLTHGDYNVIFVDWSKGNSFPYIQAAANTRVVGAQVAELIKVINGSVGANVTDFHIIGHSMGAHIGGYAGQIIPGLGRITGLDPAGPQFEDRHKKVRLDETDAIFVDIMHTDETYGLQWGIGTRILSGHLDFFPNGGHNQPNCQGKIISNFWQYNLFEAFGETLFCSHRRAVRFFSESINSNCPFMAYPCASEKAFVNNLCHSCTEVGCQRMGFHAEQIEPPTGIPMKYYLTTGGNPPYCQYHFIVTVKLSHVFRTKERGNLDLVINGSNFSPNEVSLTSDTQTFKPGQSYRFFKMLPQDFGDVQSVTLTWKRKFSLLDIFDRSNHSLYVDEIDIYREESRIDTQFCAGGQEVPTGTSLTISTIC